MKLKFDIRLPLWISILVLIIAGATVVKGLDTYTKYLRGTMTVYYADDIRITEFIYDGHSGVVNVTLTYLNGGGTPNCTVTVIQGQTQNSTTLLADWTNGTEVSIGFEMTKGVLIIEVVTE